VIGGQFVAARRSSRPHRFSAAEPAWWTKWLENAMSLGNTERSTSSTLYPLRASSRATGEPAQRAPTTITSYISGLLSKSRTLSRASEYGRLIAPGSDRQHRVVLRQWLQKALHQLSSLRDVGSALGMAPRRIAFQTLHEVVL